MTQSRRQAPDPEWVLMYRQGTTTPKITRAAGVAEFDIVRLANIFAIEEADHLKRVVPSPGTLEKFFRWPSTWRTDWLICRQFKMSNDLSNSGADSRRAETGSRPHPHGMCSWGKPRRSSSEQGQEHPTAGHHPVKPVYGQQSSSSATASAVGTDHPALTQGVIACRSNSYRGPGRKSPCR